MKKIFQRFAGALALALALASGCATDVEKEFGEEVMRLEPVEPPTFLNPEVAGLFGNANFFARVEVQKGLPGPRAPMAGELYGRDGSLFFIADEQRGKRGLAGGLSALWHGPTQTSYLLNEPLQGYAPMRLAPTNGPMEVTVVGEEELNGERCRKSIISQKTGPDLVPILVVWRGIARQDLPLRIQSTNTPTAVTITLSRIRMEPPRAELFALPEGFKKYESTDAMMSELVQRKTGIVSARGRARRDRLGQPSAEEEETTRGLQRPVRPY